MTTASEIPAVTELTVFAAPGGRDCLRLVVRGATDVVSAAIVQMISDDIERMGGEVIDSRPAAQYPSDAPAAVTAGPAALVTALIDSEDFAFSMLMLRSAAARSTDMHLAEVEERRARDHERWLARDRARQAERRARGIARMDAARVARMAARNS